jgi:glycerophosphoryl diester phosphodiesterase
MKKHNFLTWLWMVLAVSSSFTFLPAAPLKLIGHRGGVVDSTYAENSLASLKEAYRRKYYMVEIDVRLTKDGQLITQHDPDFNKYFGVKEKVQALDWQQIKAMHNNKDGDVPLLLEEVFRYCKGKLQIMLDNKITGNDTLLFKKIEELLRRYELLDKAMIIGTEEIRRYFVNKTNVCFSRAAIETLLNDKNIDKKKLLLFEHGNVLTKVDIDWANRNSIPVVPSINKFHYTDIPYMQGAERDIKNLQQWGVQFYQIDSEFDKWLN